MFRDPFHLPIRYPQGDLWRHPGPMNQLYVKFQISITFQPQELCLREQPLKDDYTKTLEPIFQNLR